MSGIILPIFCFNLLIVLSFLLTNYFIKSEKGVSTLRFLLPLSFVLYVSSIFQITHLTIKYQLILLAIAAAAYPFFSLKSRKAVLIGLLERVPLIFLQLIIFNVGWFISYRLTGGSFVTGYYVCNDPVNAAVITRDLLHNLPLNTAYPTGLFQLAAYFASFMKADIPIINFFTVLFVVSFSIYPLENFFVSLNANNKTLIYASLIIVFFSYLNTAFFYYGFFAQSASVPFILGSILLTVKLIEDGDPDYLLPLLMIMAAGVSVYSFTIIPYILVTAFIFLLIRKNWATFFRFFKSLNITHFIYIALFILPSLYYALGFFLPLFFSSSRETSLNGTMGNLPNYLPIQEIGGVWPFPDYRILRAISPRLSYIYIFLALNCLLVLFNAISCFKKSKKPLLIIVSVAVLGISLKLSTNSPYILSKLYQIASLIFISFVFVSIINLAQSNKSIILRFIIILYFVVFGAFCLRSTYFSLRYIPVISLNQKHDLISVVNRYQKYNKTYYGDNDWLLYYADPRTTRSINTHYLQGAFAKKSDFTSSYAILDSTQRSDIDSLLKKHYCVDFSGEYYSVLKADFLCGIR